MSAGVLTYLYQEDLYTIPPVQVVVVLSKAWEHYSQEDKNLLSKIIGSVKLDMASVKIHVAEKLSMETIGMLEASRVLIFGSQTDGINPYEHKAAQGFSIVKADDLSALDDARKKSLWLALRSMFGI